MKPLFNNIMQTIAATAILLSLLQCSARRHATGASENGLKDHYASTSRSA